MSCRAAHSKTHEGLLQIYFYILKLLNWLLHKFCRYYSGNVFMLALYQLCDEKMPSFFHERPNDMIVICIEAQALSQAIKEIEKLSEMTYTVGHFKYKVDMSLLRYECFA